MEQNPYAKIIQSLTEYLAGKSNASPVQIGTIVSSNPLVISLGELQIDKDNIYIADFLLKDYIRKYQSRSLSGTWSSDMEIKLDEILKAGDKVAVISTLDKQTYIVLCKVVRL